MIKCTAYLSLILFAVFIFSCCSSEKTTTSLPYDPPGATITTDKEIALQHYRTISYSNTGVFVSNEFEGASLNDFYQVNELTYTAMILPENARINDSTLYSFKIWTANRQLINLNLTYKDGTHRYRPKISYDGKHWLLYDSTKVLVDTTNNFARLKLNLTEDTL